MVITRRKSYGTSGSPSVADSTAAATAASSPSSDNSNSNDSKGTSPRLARKISDIDKTIGTLLVDLQVAVDDQESLPFDCAARVVYSDRIAKTYIELLDLFNQRLQVTNEDSLASVPAPPHFRTLSEIDQDVRDFHTALQKQQSELKGKKKSKKKSPEHIDTKILQESIASTRITLRGFVQERVRTQQGTMKGKESAAGLVTETAARLAQASLGSTPTPREPDNTSAGTSAGAVPGSLPANNSVSGRAATWQPSQPFGFAGTPTYAPSPSGFGGVAASWNYSGSGSTLQYYASGPTGTSGYFPSGQQQTSTQAAAPSGTSYGSSHPTNARTYTASRATGSPRRSYSHATGTYLAEAGHASRQGSSRAQSQVARANPTYRRTSSSRIVGARTSSTRGVGRQQAPGGHDTVDSPRSVQAVAPDAPRVRFSFDGVTTSARPSSSRTKRRARSTSWARK